MKDINKVILLGRLGADPIRRKTKSGLAVTHFSIATSHRTLKSVHGTQGGGSESESHTETEDEHEPPHSDGNEEHSEDSDSKDHQSSNPVTNRPRSVSPNHASHYKEETQWHRIIAWGKQAESCNQYLHKGSAVYVEGYIRSRNYADKQGDQKTTFEIHAETVSFLSSKSADQRPALKLAASE